MEEKLGRILEEFLEQKQRGESPRAEQFREKAGDSYAEFLKLLETENALDEAMGLCEEGDLPREFGAYTLQRELGRGAAGVVYEALHRDLGRTVALKVLRSGFDTSPDALERFRREAVACAQVRHDHIVEVYEAGQSDDKPYYAMALLEGRSLSALAKDGDIPEHRELCRRMAGIADALAAMHELEIVHRDIKPANIMVEKSGRMVLADFGLARTMYGAALTQSGEALGTPLYMSPEQLMGQRGQINGRTDVYGLGATMYKILSGRPVFDATDFLEMVRSILNERPKPLHEVAPDVPEELSRIVMKAVEKDNEDRYETAAAMRDDLLAFAEGKEVAGRPVSNVGHGMRAMKRRWLPLSVAAVVIAGAAIFLATRPVLPARLSVSCYPEADVLLDGEHFKTSPFSDAELAPGNYELTLRSEGFVDEIRPLILKPDGEASISRVLMAADPNDPKALQQLAKRYQLALVKLEDMEGQRGSEDNFVLAGFPRGNVRLEDLNKIRIDVGPEWEDQEGMLEIRVDGETIFSAPFAPENLETVIDFPAAAKRELAVGDEIEWGFYPKKGKPDVTTCKLVKEPAGLATLRDELAKQPGEIAALLEAQMLLQAGLPLAAYNLAGALKGHEHDAAQIRSQALRDMTLVNTTIWKKLRGRVIELKRGDG